MIDLDVVYRQTQEIINRSRDIIRIDDYISFENKKVSIVLSTDNFMGSIEVLMDLTYDFFITQIKTEKSFRFKTKKFENIDDLINEIKIDIKNMSKLESVGI